VCLTLYFPTEFSDPRWSGKSLSLTPNCDLEGKLLATEWSVGRMPTSDIPLLIKTVSRNHVVINYSPASKVWSVVDVGSTSGTYLNSAKLEIGNPTPIKVGDILWLADNRIHLTEDEGDTLEKEREGDTSTIKQPTIEPEALPELPPHTPSPPQLEPIGPWDIFPMIWEWFKHLPLWLEFILLVGLGFLVALWIWRCR